VDALSNALDADAEFRGCGLARLVLHKAIEGPEFQGGASGVGSAGAAGVETQERRGRKRGSGKGGNAGASEVPTPQRSGSLGVILAERP
jgi:hypothetical protein